MTALLNLIRSIFLFGRGRPVALLVLLWMTTLSGLSEVSLDHHVARFTGNFTRPFTAARQFLFTGYQKTYPRTARTQPVTIVAIDEASLAKVGQWPWPRNKLAALIDAINSYQPAAIGLDMYMPEPDQTSPENVAENLPLDAPPQLVADLLGLESHETVLAESLRNAPTVLGVAGFDHATYTSKAGLRSAPLLVAGGNALPYLRQFPAVLASLPELQAAAWGQAILSVDLDLGVVRRIPLVVAVGDEPVSGLAMEMLRIGTGSQSVRVDVGGHGIDSVSVADLMVPTQAGGDIWIHFARAESTAGRYVSAADVLAGQVDPEQLAGKLVLLGLTGSGLHDRRTTGLGELVPGIEIQAQVIESLFDGRFLLRPWWIKWAELSTTFLLGLFLIWFIPRPHSAIAGFLKTVPRASMWLTLAINFMLITLGFIVFVYLGVLFDASSFFLIISAIMGSLISSALIEIDRQASAEAAQLQQMSEVANFAAGRFSLMLTDTSSGSLTADQTRICKCVHLLARRVAQNSQLASQLDGQDIELISRAAPHRDIGMLYVPETTIDQVGDLSVQERETLQQHTRVGGIAVGKVLASLETEVAAEHDTTIRYLQILKEIAEGHHERWDGSGYPQGTAGDATPLSARIVALIDCYDSLLHDRPHRPGLEPQAALSIIKQGSGTQFDERLVEALVAVVPDFR